MRKKFTVEEAWRKFPELRDWFDRIEELEQYRAIVYHEMRNEDAVMPHISRWLEGERKCYARHFGRQVVIITQYKETVFGADRAFW